MAIASPTLQIAARAAFTEPSLFIAEFLFPRTPVPGAAIKPGEMTYRGKAFRVRKNQNRQSPGTVDLRAVEFAEPQRVFSTLEDYDVDAPIYQVAPCGRAACARRRAHRPRRSAARPRARWGRPPVRRRGSRGMPAARRRATRAPGPSGRRTSRSRSRSCRHLRCAGHLGGHVGDRLSQRDGGREADRRTDPGEVGDAHLKVLEARPEHRGVRNAADRRPAPEGLDHEGGERLDRDGGVGAHVEHAPVVRGIGKQPGQRGGDVAHVAEAAHLRARTVHLQWLAGDGRRHEARQHHPPSPPLPRAHGVEETGHGDRQRLAAVHRQRQLLVDRLGEPVRPPRHRGWPERKVVVLPERRADALPVDLAGAGHQDRRSCGGGEAQDRRGLGDVALGRGGRVLDHQPNPDGGGQVVDRVEAPAAHGGQRLGDSGDHRLEPTRAGPRGRDHRRVKVAATTRRQVVDHGHRRALRKQDIHQVRADEARPAGDQDLTMDGGTAHGTQGPDRRAVRP